MVSIQSFLRSRGSDASAYLFSKVRGLLLGAEQLAAALTLSLLDLLVVEEADRRAFPHNPISVVLLLSDRVLSEHEVRQPWELGQHIEVSELGDLVGRENEVCEVRDRLG